MTKLNNDNITKLNDEHIIPDWLKSKLIERRNFYAREPVVFDEKIALIQEILSWED
jgi:hypothetical protein